MAKIIEREKAILLRLKGTSIGEIAKRLQVSKSTVSHWCRDIALSDVAIANITKKNESKSTESLLRYTEALRKQRQQNITHDKQLGKEKVGRLSNRDVYLIGLGLYWGEGYKHGSQEFGFTNSDHNMITFYIRWLQVVFNVKLCDLILRVSINNAHESRIFAIEDFWSKLTGVPKNNFTKPSFIKSVSKKVYKDNSNYFGTLRIKVRRGTSMRRQILGAIEVLN